MATDLRLIAALLHVMKNVERMGDQCVNICKVIPLTGNEPPADEQIVKDPDDGQAGQDPDLARRSGRSSDRDVEMARDLVRQDDVVDNLNSEFFRIALEIGDDPDRREWAMTMILVARAIERIGDNAVDIGEQVAFVVTGLFREFEDASHPSSPGLAPLARDREASRPPPGDRRPARRPPTRALVVPLNAIAWRFDGRPAGVVKRG